MMPLQYSDEEIDQFILHLQQDVRRMLESEEQILPMGFALGRVSPKGDRRRTAHICYSKPVRSFSKLVGFSKNVQSMALRAEAEMAGCVLSMPAIVEDGAPEDSGIVYYDDDRIGDVRETVMIHADHLTSNHRVWVAHLEDGKLTDFEELVIWPNPEYPSFLPIELYGPVVVEA